MTELIAGSVKPENGNICIFCDDFESDQLRNLANSLKEKAAGFAVVLSGSDDSGYKYVIASEANDVSEFVKAANAALSGRGGGRGNMASGSFASSRDAIEKYFVF